MDRARGTRGRFGSKKATQMSDQPTQVESTETFASSKSVESDWETSVLAQQAGGE
jgi:hypothetical protein